MGHQKNNKRKEKKKGGGGKVANWGKRTGSELLGMSGVKPVGAVQGTGGKGGGSVTSKKGAGTSSFSIVLWGKGVVKVQG